MACGGPVKTNSKFFPKDEIEKVMKHWPSGAKLVMRCETPRGVDLFAVGYKYNSKKVLLFVFTNDAGPTTDGEPYEAKFDNGSGTTAVRLVPRPAVVSNYFRDSNVIDAHNHVRQSELALEEHWIVKNPWFRIDTTYIGITVTDCWKLYKHGRLEDPEAQKLGIVDFADRCVQSKSLCIAIITCWSNPIVFHLFQSCLRLC